MEDDSGATQFPHPEHDPLVTEQQFIRWILSYNAYDRLAGGGSGGPMALYYLLQPLVQEYRAGGTIPDWAGVDLLRGWLFLLVRWNRHEDGYLLDTHPEIYGIVEAIKNHPAAHPSDMPPPPPPRGLLR